MNWGQEGSLMIVSKCESHDAFQTYYFGEEELGGREGSGAEQDNGRSWEELAQRRRLFLPKKKMENDFAKFKKKKKKILQPKEKKGVFGDIFELANIKQQKTTQSTLSMANNATNNNNDASKQIKAKLIAWDRGVNGRPPATMAYSHEEDLKNMQQPILGIHPSAFECNSCSSSSSSSTTSSNILTKLDCFLPAFQSRDWRALGTSCSLLQTVISLPDYASFSHISFEENLLNAIYEIYRDPMFMGGRGEELSELRKFFVFLTTIESFAGRIYILMDDLGGGDRFLKGRICAECIFAHSCVEAAGRGGGGKLANVFLDFGTKILDDSDDDNVTLVLLRTFTVCVLENCELREKLVGMFRRGEKVLEKLVSEAGVVRRAMLKLLLVCVWIGVSDGGDIEGEIARNIFEVCKGGEALEVDRSFEMYAAIIQLLLGGQKDRRTEFLRVFGGGEMLVDLICQFSSKLVEGSVLMESAGGIEGKGTERALLACIIMLRQLTYDEPNHFYECGGGGEIGEGEEEKGNLQLFKLTLAREALKSVVDSERVNMAQECLRTIF